MPAPPARRTKRPQGEHLDMKVTLLGLCVAAPRPDALVSPVARDLIVLLDTSGSTSGERLEQARRIVGALIDTLGKRD